ncbi:MAG TPA: TrkH family potassium uptake protein [Candidatus Hydrogenedentes bacterium]|jgi:trk system potassium uptake protein TrkH|nr:TrkH family potassium uptake protein [Candidatus Hydrogenedentota bacterium]
MNFREFIKNMGLFSAAASPMFFPPLLCALFYQEMAMALVFLLSVFLMAGAGGILFAVGKGSKRRLQQRETLGLVGAGWLLVALYGAIPYVLSGEFSFIDAYFESMSGFSTTGASVLSDIEALPKSLLFWRSFTHWLGGLGIILLLIIVLPFLGAGGKLLYRSEMPGLEKSSFKPRVKNSALFLFKIYMGLTLIMTLLLLLAGMDLFDSLCHTFGTLATGGFSTRNASIAYYDSPLIECIISLFMIIAGTSFSLIYCFFVGEFRTIYKNGEWRLYLLILAASVVLITWNVSSSDQSIPGLIGQEEADTDMGFPGLVRLTAFQTISTMTCTGFCVTDFNQWPDFSRMLLLMLMIIGGCSGSTSGGLKVVRVLLLVKMARWHLVQTFRPKDIRVFHVDNLVIDKGLQNSILAYFTLYSLVFGMAVLALTASDMPVITSISAVASCFNGVGPGLEQIGAVGNYGALSALGKITLSLIMAMGRLEIYAICVLFLPSFWQKH